MAFDSHKNFAYSNVATAPSPASSGTSLVVTGGDGTKFPTPPFNATVWPANTQPTPANAEIVRVTNIATDTFTITRTQESTSARTILVGDQIAATITAKTATDIETAVNAVQTNVTVIQPFSAFPVTTSNTFPYVYVGGGANSKQDTGLGVAASIGADSTWRLRFQIPPVIPAGTSKFRLLGLANATSGTAKITPAVANVAAGASPSGATLTNETQISLTWGAGDNDKYKESKAALSTAPTANSIYVMDLVFNTTGWTLAQISCWLPSIIWE